MNIRQYATMALLAWLTFSTHEAQAFYNPQTGRWLNRDRVSERVQRSRCAFLKNNPCNAIDILGQLDYVVGRDSPAILPDPGAGTWNTVEADLVHLLAAQNVQNLLNVSVLGIDIGDVLRLPDAVAHLRHFFGNSGTDYKIRLRGMLHEVRSAEVLYNVELHEAMLFVEGLPEGQHTISSRRASFGYNDKSVNENWFYAVGGYSSWGDGTAKVCGDKFTLEFDYNFRDRYNWDNGKSVEILGITVTDEFMGGFHLMGLAQEFDMWGAVRKKVSWRRGERSQIYINW